MKYFIFLLAMLLWHMTVNADKLGDSGIYSGKKPVPSLKLNEAIPACNDVEPDVNTACISSAKVKFTRVVISQDGKPVPARGWKMDASNVVWLDADPGNKNKNLENIEKNCKSEGAELPTIEELAQLADSGYIDILKKSPYLKLIDFSNLRIWSNSKTEEPQQVKTMNLASKKEEKTKTNNIVWNDFRYGSNFGLCVIRQK